MFDFVCKPCSHSDKKTDTVRVTFPPAGASDKENAAPEPTVGQLGKLEEEQRQAEERRQQEEAERLRLEQEERRRREEAARRVLEQQREEERQLRLREEKRAREAAELRKRQEEKEEARRRAEEARKQEQLQQFLSKNGFAGANEKKKKGGMLSSGFTYPLHAAVKTADAQTVALLLWAGADGSLKDSAKLTPLMLAQKLDKNGSHRSVIEALSV